MGWTKEILSPVADVTSFDTANHENVDIVGDIYELTTIFKDKQKFDVAIISDVFEHLPDIPKALKEVLGIMNPGGIILLSTPFQKELHGEEYGDYFRITRQGWKYMLTEAGCIDIKIQWVGSEKFPKAYMVSSRKKS